MAALLVRDAPTKLHDWLKTAAKENRRSVNQQIVFCLEWCMSRMTEESHAMPAPLKVRGGSLTLAEIDAAKKAGRK